MLQEAFSLLAYADPWNSPVGAQLDPARRETICSALNSAILGKSVFSYYGSSPQKRTSPSSSVLLIRLEFISFETILCIPNRKEIPLQDSRWLKLQQPKCVCKPAPPHNAISPNSRDRKSHVCVSSKWENTDKTIKLILQGRVTIFNLIDGDLISWGRREWLSGCY